MNNSIEIWFKRITYAVIIIFFSGIMVNFLVEDFRFSNLRWIYTSGKMFYLSGLVLSIIVGLLNSIFIVFVSKTKLKVKIMYSFLTLLPFLIVFILMVNAFSG